MADQMKLDIITSISGVNPRKCMKCGKCSGACPAYDEMEYHPHQFVSMVECSCTVKYHKKIMSN